MKILITGASGSGTTTLGKALAQELNINHLDSDDFFWLPTNPPYTERRPTNERLEMIQAELEKHEHTVVSGSVMGWGELLENAFDLIVFLYLETEIRIARLKVREQEEVGFVNPEFIEWAASYDTGPEEGRSLAKHAKWHSERESPILRIEGNLTVSERLRMVKNNIMN
jgi:adenylate kinase family enzyme